ncbi:fatty acid desaturase [Pelagibius litoralis]|uniref:fatty acid desaturase n=1 Tax=Pelagibius litoralis TaxID=374515 RepID=UPI00197E55D2|nr:fatty acid desaturase [Pelagibius litoralis]
MKTKTTASPPASAGPKQWAQTLAGYRDPNHSRSIFEIAVTVLPFTGLWLLSWAAIHYGYWPLAIFPAVLAAVFLVRLFMIQHDCGHGAFFRSRLANDWVGRAISVLTLTPYDGWRQAHAVHHASTGNLDRRGVGDIDTLTVREYQALTYWGRLRYRLYRHPIVMFGIGPAYIFVLQHRLPHIVTRNRRQAWFNAMATNLASAAVIATVIWFIGFGPFLLVQLPITLLAASIGVWLFYVQHQFEGTFWAEDPEWDLHEAALHGSSHYDLPHPLRWLTANIGMHHLHHLCSRIPYYRLPRVMRDHPDLKSVGRLTLWQSLSCVRLTLWCETTRRLISFREARAES